MRNLSAGLAIAKIASTTSQISGMVRTTTSTPPRRGASGSSESSGPWARGAWAGAAGGAVEEKSRPRPLAFVPADLKAADEIRSKGYTVGTRAMLRRLRLWDSVSNFNGWGGRIRTSVWRNQNPLPYHLATPHWRARTILGRDARGNGSPAAGDEIGCRGEHLPPVGGIVLTTVTGVRRGKAALSSGCKAHPATAPAGSNRSSYGGDEIAEAFGMRVTNW